MEWNEMEWNCDGVWLTECILHVFNYFDVAQELKGDTTDGQQKKCHNPLNKRTRNQFRTHNYWYIRRNRQDIFQTLSHSNNIALLYNFIIKRGEGEECGSLFIIISILIQYLPLFLCFLLSDKILTQRSKLSSLSQSFLDCRKRNNLLCWQWKVLF